MEMNSERFFPFLFYDITFEWESEKNVENDGRKTKKKKATTTKIEIMVKIVQ